MATVGKLGKLAASETALFVCDVQERFRQIISGMPAVIDTSRRMVRAADALGMPVLVTEQYPEKLGSTVPEVTDVMPDRLLLGSRRFPKKVFSMIVPEVRYALRTMPHVKTVLLCGIETHVCVLQTTLDLIERGYEVHVLVDGVSSQRPADRAVALQRLAQSGAYLATSEMALFQMMGSTEHPAFKTISGLCKEQRADPLPMSML